VRLEGFDEGFDDAMFLGRLVRRAAQCRTDVSGKASSILGAVTKAIVTESFGQAQEIDKKRFRRH
jgi:hypothetical protein